MILSMGASKTEHFTDEQNEMANLMKAIGHPARVAIIAFLLKTDSCICGDIVNELPLSQPTVSQHLRELKSAGIIQGTVEGTAICYCLNPTTIEKIQTYIQTIHQSLQQKKGASCC
jgi:ArsR family transcriptional regulator